MRRDLPVKNFPVTLSPMTIDAIEHEARWHRFDDELAAILAAAPDPPPAPPPPPAPDPC